MKDLSQMTASELQQMLTNIYALASAYEMEEAEKVERITIMYDSDSAQKLALLEHDPEEYYSQKYSQGPTYSDDEVLNLAENISDISGMQKLIDVVNQDRPKYIPQTFERIKKILHYSMHLLKDTNADSLRNLLP